MSEHITPQNQDTDEAELSMNELEDVAGGLDTNNGCTINNGCTVAVNP
jgi:hypothetical protein